MSRLESFLRRLSAQRDGLNWATKQINGLSGDALELGLGNGRSYDHMREVAGERRIWVIDRGLHCHPSCVPPTEDFLEGDAEAMLIRMAQNKTRLILAHYDFGIGVKKQDADEAAHLSPFIAKLMLPGGILLSSQPLLGFTEVQGPKGIAPGRYMFYRS